MIGRDKAIAAARGVWFDMDPLTNIVDAILALDDGEPISFTPGLRTWEGWEQTIIMWKERAEKAEADRQRAEAETQRLRDQLGDAMCTVIELRAVVTKAS